MGIKKFWSKNQREMSLIIALIIMVVIFAAINPIYIKWDNLRDIIDQAAIYGLMGLGMTFVIISGGINLSVGSALALVSVLISQMLVSGIHPAIVIIVGLMIGFVCGLFDGLLITKLQLQPFIATLGTMSLYRGLAFVVTKGLPVTGVPKEYRNLVNGEIFEGFRLPIVILIVTVFIAYVILKYTRLGSYIYAIGGNEEATRLSGVKVDLYKTLSYGICTVGTALAALVLVARLGTGEPTAGNGYELNAIAAVAIGGTSMAGGKGGAVGTFLGAVLFSGLKTGLIVAGVDTFYQYIATGLVIIIAAYIEVAQSSISSNKLLKNK